MPENLHERVASEIQHNASDVDNKPWLWMSVANTPTRRVNFRYGKPEYDIFDASRCIRCLSITLKAISKLLSIAYVELDLPWRLFGEIYPLIASIHYNACIRLCRHKFLKKGHLSENNLRTAQDATGMSCHDMTVNRPRVGHLCNS